MPALGSQRASELRLILTNLGPTFIKFGQVLSIRPDLIPPEYVYEVMWCANRSV